MCRYVAFPLAAHAPKPQPFHVGRPTGLHTGVLEYKVLPTDPDVAQTGPTVKKISSHVASRLVFAGHLEIPS
jgi:hypothetical protein